MKIHRKQYTWHDWAEYRLGRMRSGVRELYEPVIKRDLERGWTPPAITEKQIRTLKRRATDHRYNTSDKGRARKVRYLQSDKGRTNNRIAQTKYNHSQAGKNRKLEYYWNNRDLCNYRTSLWRLRKNWDAAKMGGTWEEIERRQEEDYQRWQLRHEEWERQGCIGLPPAVGED
jgi:hypothetical protein